jgi:cystathionine gamma-synthase
VRGGEPDRHGYDAVTVPVVCASTYGFRDSGEIRDLFEGSIEREEYGRYGNPTVRAAETKLAALERAADAVLFPSGMSAITTLMFSMLKPGDHVVLTSDCYRRTRQLVTDSLSRWGVDHALVDGSDLAAVDRAVVPARTRMLFSEAPTNPYLRVIDVPGFAAIRRKNPRVKLVVDSTLGSPLNFRPLELGADLVVHSCTKYLGGHNDLLAGAICGSRELVDALRAFRGLFGSMPDPHGAYLLVRGMKTLAVRMRQHNANGERIARFLSQHPAIERVYYPGLPSHPDHGSAARQFGGFGGVVSFMVRGDLQTTSRFIDNVRLATIGPSMGGVETLIEQPALMSFYGLSPEERRAVGIEDNLVRLSVGLEDAEDIIDDLDAALNRA